MRAIGVIPARYHSTRLEGKCLQDIEGKPMVQHVYERARVAQSLADVLVATDDDRIFKVVAGFGGKAVMTSSQHASGTDRVAEAVENLDVDVVVNIQGDEPLLEPILIDECLTPFSWKPPAQIATVMKQVPEEVYSDPAVVKVVRDLAGRALYFSRSLLPFPRNRTKDFHVYEHIGIYAYTKETLLEFSRLAPTSLELIEVLEQLRAYRAWNPRPCCGNPVAWGDALRGYGGGFGESPPDHGRVRKTWDRKMRPDRPLIDQLLASLTQDTWVHLDLAIGKIVEAKRQNGSVVVVTGSGPNIHEGVTTLIAELMRKGIVDGVITSSAVVAHEMAGTLDRVKRVSVADDEDIGLPVKLLPRGRMFEVTVLALEACGGRIDRDHLHSNREHGGLAPGGMAR